MTVSVNNNNKQKPFKQSDFVNIVVIQIIGDSFRVGISFKRVPSPPGEVFSTKKTEEKINKNVNLCTQFPKKNFLKTN